MAEHSKSSEELLKELEVLKLENESLKALYAQDITELILTEDALLESEQQLTSIYNTVGDIIFFLEIEEDGHYRFISVNPSFCRVTGIPREALIGKRVNEIIQEPSLSIVLEKYRRATEEKTPVHWEETTDYPAGRLTGEVSVAPVFDASGRCKYLVGSVHDITEHKRTEEALKKREARYLDLIEHASDGIFIADSQGNYLDVNSSACNMIGYSREEILKLNIKDLVRPEVQAELPLKLKELGSGKILLWERLLIRKNGTTLPTEISAKILDDGTFQAIVRDISERKRAEEILYEGEKRMRLIVEGTPHLFFYTQDVNANITYISPSVVNITGHSLDDWNNQSHWFLTKNKINKYAQKITHVHLKGELTKGPVIVEIEHADKYPILLEIYESPIIVNGVVVGLQGVAHDITMNKQAEKARLESERLSAIGEMSAAVAHDFNNSLQVILGNLEMALKVSGISSKVEAFLKAAKRSSDDAASRIQLLQRFARKKGSVEFFVVNLNELLDEVILQTRPLWKDEAEKKGIEISFNKLYGEIKPIDGDPGEIRTVFHNIIKNAVEAMPKGGLITISTGVTIKDVFVRISDNGIGMNEETKKRVFQPFFTTKGFEAGRGLGMSGTYSVMRDHKGIISVAETAVGKGTTIEILFPFGIKNVVDLGKEVTDESLIPARVLWVDDDKNLRQIEKEILESLGHYIDTAASGKEALSLLEINNYDLLITDVGMPGMSGWQLAETIKGKYNNLKVVIVSGWSADVSDEEKEKYGIGYVLGKPVTIEKLRNLVDEVLKSKI
jgi:PAS domain S-box-containing protein